MDTFRHHSGVLALLRGTLPGHPPLYLLHGFISSGPLIPMCQPATQPQEHGLLAHCRCSMNERMHSLRYSILVHATVLHTPWSRPPPPPQAGLGAHNGPACSSHHSDVDGETEVRRAELFLTTSQGWCPKEGHSLIYMDREQSLSTDSGGILLMKVNPPSVLCLPSYYKSLKL